MSATKQMSISMLPRYLIVHFKRFSYLSNQTTRKITKHIEFPINGLDMSHICQEINFGENIVKDNKCIYDLYAISNHYGTLSGGHYSAFCKSIINNNFYEFDDTSIKLLEESKIPSYAAYVLFYKLR